jgi:hypothetical protein
VVNMRILGIVICLVLAGAYYFVWPGWKDPGRVRHRPVWSNIVLRWFHSLTWVLLAAACFLRSTLPAALAGGVYLIFLVALASERRTAKKN